jgi:hypothetical protein
MIEGQKILMGWKDMANICGITPKTMKRKAIRHKLPYRRIDGRPCILFDDFMEWFKKISKN